LTQTHFKDLFSGHASAYAAYRPDWPPELFDWLASRCERRELAWDCGTGNGQAARQLARFFDRVLATDASERQISQAAAAPGVRYRIEAAERCSLFDDCADLVLAAQAWHWFDQKAFHREAVRVLRPAGVLAVASYGLVTSKPDIDAVVQRLHRGILDGWWARERAIVDGGLEGIDLPFDGRAAPRFEMSARWRLDDLLNYLGTWSAVRRFRSETGRDPLNLVRGELAAAWGKPDRRRKLRWPIAMKWCLKD
jgi:SAM-dependent methyltransferase